MKKRYNISIEFEIMEEAKTKIKNISAFIEKCLDNYNKGINTRRNINASKNAYYDAINKYGGKEKLEKIINTKWLDF